MPKRLDPNLDSKSDAIRLCKKENPDFKPAKIASYLNKQGFDVLPQFVSTILSNDRRKHGNWDAESVPVFALLEVKEFVVKVGGIEQARAALSEYERLVGD